MLITEAGGKIMNKEHCDLRNDPFSSNPEPTLYFAPKDGADPVSEIMSAVAREKLLVVLTGTAGSGKTTCLKRVVDQLDPQCHKVVFVNNPARTFPPLLREIVGQLENRTICKQSLDHYARSFRAAVLAIRCDRRRAVVIIDNFCALEMGDLASLHSLLTQDGSAANATFVIAGGLALRRALSAPNMSSLFESICIYCETEELQTKESMQAYIENRLRKAGQTGTSPFSEQALTAIWISDANRTPRNLNSICRLCLQRIAAAGKTRVDVETVTEVCSEFYAEHARPLPPIGGAFDMQYANARRPPHARNPLRPPQDSADPAKSRLASQLATDRMKHIDKVIDPFEAWTAAREEILHALSGRKLRHAAE